MSKHTAQSRGAAIMELAEKLRPAFVNFFIDKRDLNGMLFQPAHIRAIALNYAEYLVKAVESGHQQHANATV